MKKGIALTLAFALLLSLALVPMNISRAAEDDNPLAEALNALNAQDNLRMDMDMALDLNMAITSGGQTIMSMPMNLALTLNMDTQIKPACYFAQMSMDMNAMGNTETMNALLYMEQSDEGYATYSSADGGANWTVSRIKAGEAPKIDPASASAMFAKSIKDFAATGTEVLDGVEAVIYSGKLDAAFLQETLASAGAADKLDELSEETGLDADFLSNLGDIPFTMSIDPATHLPLKMTIDMTDLLNNLLGSLLKQAMGLGDMEGYEVNVEVGTTVVECRMKDYNAVGPVAVPESVKAVAVESSSEFIEGAAA